MKNLTTKLLVMSISLTLAGNLYAKNICSTSLPTIIYLDDVGTQDQPGTRISGRDDANGVQDVGILLKWEKEMDLIAIGSTSRFGNKDLSMELVRRIVSANNLSTPVLAGKDLIDFITVKAREIESCNNGKKLDIVIGGHWDEVMCALRSDPYIADLINITGIGSWNIRNQDYSNPRDLAFCMKPGELLNPQRSFQEISSIMPANSIFRISDKRTYPGTVPAGIRDFICPTTKHTLQLMNRIYDNGIAPMLNKVRDPSDGIIISDIRSPYVKEAIALGNLQCSNVRNQSTGLKIRVADFLAVAHVLSKKYKTKNSETKKPLNYLSRDEIYPYIEGDLKFKNKVDIAFLMPIIMMLLEEDEPTAE